MSPPGRPKGESRARSAGSTTAPGRTCPADYGYPPAALARPADLAAEVLYVAGGLYGNRWAFAAIERMADSEGAPVQLVFNGDFHWFDAEADAFLEIERGVARHVALRGNVETEVARDDSGNGCGCAYPESVPDADVERSNRILARLRAAARKADARAPGLTARLAALPMHAVADIGGVRVALVHGDAWALAGWRFAHGALHGNGDAESLAAAFEQAAVDGFASSHTCLPALKTLDTPLGERFVVNNGAAGMANFRGTRHGVITRIAALPVPAQLHAARLYGADVAGVYVDALAVHFDAAAWEAAFARIWPHGSDAQLSYGQRIVDGPIFSIDDALGRAPARGCTPLAA